MEKREMSLVTYNGLVEIVERGIIEGAPPEHINAASIDVTLGRYIWFESSRGGVVYLADKQVPIMKRHDLLKCPFHLRPGEFVLAQTQEVFNLPNMLAIEFRLKS